MNGMVLLQTKQLAPLSEFYTDRIGCTVWLEQPECKVFRHGNLLFGFCKRATAQKDVTLTFDCESKAAVDSIYTRLGDFATGKPKANSKLGRYCLLAHDPEGRSLELQCPSKPANELLTGDQLLLSRRSIRTFRKKQVSPETLHRLIDICRFAPSSQNFQSFYFRVISDPDTLDMLAISRSGSSDPIGTAPMAVAICSDPALSRYNVQDACIAATYFLLAARQLGLGTCWIGNMDTPGIKKLIGVPKDHYVATVTPLGYPAGKMPAPPERKPVEEFIR